MTDTRLKGRIAVITGGSSGLGAATAIRFAESGARIVVADLKSGEVEKKIVEKHGKDAATFVKCDVTQESDIENMVKLFWRSTSHYLFSVTLFSCSTVITDLSFQCKAILSTARYHTLLPTL